MRLPVDKLYKQPITQLEARADVLADVPDVRIATPLFTATGLADADSQPVTQYNFVSALCAAGDRVEWRYYPHTTHSGSVMRSREQSVSFVRDVLAGRPTSNLCSALVPPGPLQTPEG